METKKTKPKARRMWAHPFDAKCPPVWWQLSRVRLESSNLNYTVPVAVIPLDDVQTMIDRATGAHYNAVQAHPCHVPTPGAMRAALTAIGVLPRARKGRK
jgi:hypothetical protein